MFERIDHVGLAVSDLERATGLYEETFGMPVAHRETVESQGCLLYTSPSPRDS